MTADGRLPRALLTLHAVADPDILDVCANVGVMWRGLERHFRVTPHLTQTGHGPAGNSRGYGARYGTHAGAADLDGPNIVPLFRPFLVATRGVLRDDHSIVVAKIGDVVRSNRRQWQPLEFILAAREQGFTPCEEEPLPVRGFAYDPKNIHQFHLRSRTYWIVLHAGPSCVGPGVGVAHVCAVPECGRPFRGRADALTCSSRCRQRRARLQKRNRRTT